ncbi:hypothetical protein PG984_013025 [Apiospora sp. TS-2023a]
MSDLIGSDAGSLGRLGFLDWLCRTFEGMLVPTPRPARIAEMPGYGSFLLLNNRTDWYARFKGKLRDKGFPEGGMAAFHGAPPHALFSILCDGLTAQNGVYYSNEPAHAAWYIAWRSLHPTDSTNSNYPMVLQGWKNGRYKDVALLFGVEVAGPQPKIEEVEDQSPPGEVMVRYLFLIPGEKVEPLRNVGERYWERYPYKDWLVEGALIEAHMGAIYDKIHNGSLMVERGWNDSEE